MPFPLMPLPYAFRRFAFDDALPALPLDFAFQDADDTRCPLIIFSAFATLPPALFHAVVSPSLRAIIFLPFDAAIDYGHHYAGLRLLPLYIFFTLLPFFIFSFDARSYCCRNEGHFHGCRFCLFFHYLSFFEFFSPRYHDAGVFHVISD